MLQRVTILNLMLTMLMSIQACQPASKQSNSLLNSKLSYSGPAELRYTEVGDGSFVFQTENGTLYEPVALPSEFAVHGLKVEVQLAVDEEATNPNAPGGCKCAPRAKILQIRKIDTSPLCTAESKAGLAIQLVDSGGEAVRNASVRVVPVANDQPSEALEESGDDGLYQGLFEKPGNFSVWITKEGFKELQVPVTIVAGVCHVQTKSLELTLQPE